MNINITKKIALGATVVVGAVTIATAPFMAYAATTADSQLTQEIVTGSLSTDILDAGGSDVASPTFAMTQATVSNQQQTSTGTFGDNGQRITVDNPQSADSGWTLTWNATTPGTGKWTDAAKNYPYNDTAANGRLTINPSVGTLTSVVGTSTGITKGSSASFSSTTSLTLLSAAAGSDDIWNGYLTGVSLSQTIPASQEAGNYTLDMTQTVASV